MQLISLSSSWGQVHAGVSGRTEQTLPVLYWLHASWNRMGSCMHGSVTTPPTPSQHLVVCCSMITPLTACSYTVSMVDNSSLSPLIHAANNSSSPFIIHSTSHLVPSIFSNRKAGEDFGGRYTVPMHTNSCLCPSRYDTTSKSRGCYPLIYPGESN